MKSISFAPCPLIVLLITCFAGALSVAQPATGPFELNFDDGRKLGELFRANGNILLSGGDAPEAEGRALRVKSEGDFAFFTVDEVLEADFTTADTVSLRIFNPEGETQRFDFLGIEGDKKAILWKKVEFDHQGWKEIELPMEWFRWNRGRAPLWNKVKSIGLRGSGGLDFWLDDIQIRDSDPEEGPEVTPADVKSTVFPGLNTICSKTDEGVWVITNSEELDVEELHTHLTSVRDKLLEVFPMWKNEPGEATPAMMIVTKDREEYREVFGRIGEKLTATIPVSNAGGYHVQGIGFSYFDPEFGTKRPVFTHEFTHSVASSAGRIDFAGRDWFQEGLASFVQARAHPQKGLGMIILTGILNADNRDPLKELTSGDSISMKRYWQAMTLVDYLVHSPEMKPRFPDLMKAIDSTGSTDLSRHLEAIYGISFEELEEKWQHYTKNHLYRFDPSMKKPE